MFRYSSSLRVRPIEETLVDARALGRAVGIARVTDTTRHDRLGVPVFAAIRPDAMTGSLCVSAGKGLRPEEAEIGAYMEAIELAHAEPRRARVERIAGTARDILDAHARGIDALIDLCPLYGVRLDLDQAVELVAAEDIFTGERQLVPVDRVLMPVEATFYGSDSNGLSSGNSVLEATVHGVAELVERDIEAFLLVKDTTEWVRNETLPMPLAEIAQRVAANGLTLHVRHHANQFNLPFFIAVLLEPGARDGVWTGLGCHPWSAIAATRAITEAFQSRLTIIHGGRDDLGSHMAKFARLTERERKRMHDQVAELANPVKPSVSFADVVDRSFETPTIEASLSVITDELRAAGLHRFLRVVLTPPDSSLAVVRMIIPGLEFSLPGHRQRLGHRLIAALARRA